MMTRFGTILLTILFPVMVYAQTGCPIPDGGDEFTGPFSSWLNAKTGFGAKGDGRTDDTRALQAALDAAGKSAVNPTLYLPAGTYRITGTLTLNHQINVSVIGEDPATTMIKWTGPAHGTMLQLNGTAYSKLNRLTWNGSGTADVAIEQSWDGGQPHFDTGNEYADDTFIDVGFGIHGGHLGHGFAETSILRDRFIRNTMAGISLGNFNALDIWIRNCLFQDCVVGVTNTFGAGNFKIYQCIFRNSSKYDISMGNTGEFSVRCNTSIHSAQFFFAGFTRNPAPSTLEGNTIIEPTTTTAIVVNNQGPTLLIGNTIRSLPGAAGGPVAKFSSTAFSWQNTFTVTDPISAGSGSFSDQDRVVPVTSLKNLVEPVLPSSRPQVKRKIFEVPVGANAGIIQAVINRAAKASGSRPVVHFPFGQYDISTTIQIPAGTDMQLIGDGFGDQNASMLNWTGGAAAMIKINGPGSASLQDLTLRGNASCTNILIANADQKNARILLQEFHQVGGKQGLLVSQLDNTQILAFDAAFSGLDKAVTVVGGPRAGSGAKGQTLIYSGAESNNKLSHEVLDGGRLVVQDTWYEGRIKTTFASLSGNSSFMAIGDHIATDPANEAIVLNNFSGSALLAADYLDGLVSIQPPSRGGNILVLGSLTEGDRWLKQNPVLGTDTRLLMNRQRNHGSTIVRGGSYTTDDDGVYNRKFIQALINATTAGRNANWGPETIRLSRVMSLGGAIGLDIEAH